MTTHSTDPGRLGERTAPRRRDRAAGAAVDGRAGARAAPAAVGEHPRTGQAAGGRATVAARRLGAGLRRHWPVLPVLALYVLAACVVPTMAPAPVSDDWVYARTVEILFARGELEILDLSVVTQLFQTAWGAAFAALFGLSFGSLRLATVVLTLLSGGAFYALCRQLGVARGRAALGTAAYLFNPLAFALAFSFMSDPYFTALLVIATCCLVRALHPPADAGDGGGVDRRWLLAGAVAAALTFLARQQGALIPFAAVLALLLGRRLRPDRRSLLLFAGVVAIPAATTILYYLWLRFVHGVPKYQTTFLNEVRAAGWAGARLLVARLTFIGTIYAGFFGLPLAAAALPGGWGAGRLGRPLPWLLFWAWAAIVVAGLVLFGLEGWLMPYVPQFFTQEGLGPSDLYGGRPPFFDTTAVAWLTVVCAIGALVLALAGCGRLGDRAAPRRGAAGLVATIGLWQAIGILPASFHFLHWSGSLDRYLLPLLPFTIALGLWATRDARLVTPLGWLVVAAFALFAVAGTRDFLTFQRATWDLAREANALGVPNTRLDAGASWDGYHLYEYSRDNRIPPQTPERPWWVDLFAPATNSDYLVASLPFDGFVVVRQVEYSAWLQREPTYLYLLRRGDLSGPP